TARGAARRSAGWRHRRHRGTGARTRHDAQLGLRLAHEWPQGAARRHECARIRTRWPERGAGPGAKDSSRVNHRPHREAHEAGRPLARMTPDEAWEELLDRMDLDPSELAAAQEQLRDAPREPVDLAWIERTTASVTRRPIRSRRRLFAIAASILGVGVLCA